MKKIYAVLFASLAILSFSSCSKDADKVYTNFKITSVKVTQIPFTDVNSVSWDSFDGPEVYFNIEDGSFNVLRDGSNSYYSNVTANSFPLTWNLSSAYQITNLSYTNYIAIYDYDTLDADDMIGYMALKMDDHKSGYPTTITKTSGNITIIITGVWY